ncbi:preprotein translocase subunit SecA [Candidatus Pelagibacter sp.]|nr:preprotein translocase subunit SecA [Candidatus Pelagibacter sp.]
MLNPLSFISKIFKSSNQNEIDKIQYLLKKVNNLEKEISSLEDKDFPKKTAELKSKLTIGGINDEIICQAFALVREASKRKRGERHFDVQILGGIVLHQGKIAEMKTGEGKTITIALAAYLNSLYGKGVHVVTVNDYLAKRDCENMSKIYNFLGVSCGFINNYQEDEERLKNYNCDITYATNSELGFDYLKDNMKMSLSQIVQKNRHFAIVDEIDSCLIDEARTPLVISGQAEDTSKQYKSINKFVKSLTPDAYEIDEKDRSIILTNSGIDNIEKILGRTGILKNNNFYDPANLHIVHHVNQALKANFIFKKDKDYVLVDGKIKIVDEITGRILEGRRYADGLHQAIEAKENVKIEIENQTLASITYQNYFKLYEKLSGCTGTALTESQEFFEIYNLQVVSIPTNKKMIRKDLNDKIFRTEKEKQNAIINLIAECNKRGQPVLVFTSSVDKSEIYSDLLRRKRIEHTVLNAKNHEKEAEIIANAGKLNSVIITTSISGRGVDIQLGGKKGISGDAENNEKVKIKSLGGLFVIGTERMESRRVDNQARGRSGRQGDEGNSIFFVSLEDDLMRIFGSESINTMLEKLGLKDGESIDHPWINKALERAQQKVEARNFDIRKTLLKFDNVINDQRQVIFNQRKEILNTEEINQFVDKLLEDEINYVLIEKNKSLNFEGDKGFRSKFEILLQNNDQEYLDKIFSSNQNDIKLAIKEKFLEKRKYRISKISEIGNKDLERKIFLQIIDLNWKNHIQYLEQLRQVIGLRSYGQRDPLVEYKKECFELFEKLLEKIRQDTLMLLLNLRIT